MALEVKLIFSQTQSSILVTSEPGQAFYALANGNPVTVSVQAVGGVPAGLLFTVLTGPADSALIFPLTSTGNTLVFTPDVAGGYGPVSVVANGDDSISDTRAVSVADSLGVVRLPYGTVVDDATGINQANFDGNDTGLAIVDDTTIQAIHDVSAAASTAQSTATAAGTAATTAQSTATAAGTAASTAQSTATAAGTAAATAQSTATAAAFAAAAASSAAATAQSTANAATPKATQVHVGSGSSGLSLSHTDGSYDTNPKDLSGDLYIKVVAGTVNAAALGWFDVTASAYGALGDNVTDDGPAFNLAINAAIDWTGSDYTSAGRYARRGGTVYAPPTPQLSAYRIRTTVGFNFTQAGMATGGPSHFQFIASGADGPFRPDMTADTIDCMSFRLAGLEWTRVRFANLCFMSRDIVPNSNAGLTWTRGANAECNSALHVEASAGACVIDLFHTIGTWCKLAQLRLSAPGCTFTVNNFHNAGALSYNAVGHAGHIFCDQTGLVRINEPFDYGEFAFWGIDNAGGFADAFIKIDPTADAGWGPTQVYIREIQASSRCTNMVYCYPTHGGVTPAEIVDIAGIHASVNSDLVQLSYCNKFKMRDGKYIAGFQRNMLNGFSVKKVDIRDITVSAGFEPIITVDSGCLILEVTDVALGSVSGAPCGVVLASATATAAYVTLNGLRGRVRRCQAAVALNTWVKPGATDGRVDQLGTGDDSRQMQGISLDAGTTSDYIRVAEDMGQDIPVKLDASAGVAPGDIAIASVSVAGASRKTTTVGASTLALFTSTTSASGTARAIMQKSQY